MPIGKALSFRHFSPIFSPPAAILRKQRSNGSPTLSSTGIPAKRLPIPGRDFPMVTADEHQRQGPFANAGVCEHLPEMKFQEAKGRTQCAVPIERNLCSLPHDAPVA